MTVLGPTLAFFLAAQLAGPAPSPTEPMVAPSSSAPSTASAVPAPEGAALLLAARTGAVV